MSLEIQKQRTGKRSKQEREYNILTVLEERKVIKIKL